MGVRKQGEDNTNQIRKVVIKNFQVRDLECKRYMYVSLLLVIGCRVSNLVYKYYSDDLIASEPSSTTLVPESFRRDTS